MWKLNSSNPGKIEEFNRLFAKYGEKIESTHFDLAEIDADPIRVIAHKASHLGENILVEDTSLEVEGASFGTNIRWLMDHLSDFEGHRAECIVLLGFKQDNQVYIYKGSVSGIIVKSQGKNRFGFDPMFLPIGTTLTLAESKPDIYNARAKAVDALMKNEVFQVHPAIHDWDGPWQS